jgi:hypothetical protein
MQRVADETADLLPVPDQAARTGGLSDQVLHLGSRNARSRDARCAALRRNVRMCRQLHHRSTSLFREPGVEALAWVGRARQQVTKGMTGGSGASLYDAQLLQEIGDHHGHSHREKNKANRGVNREGE